MLIAVLRARDPASVMQKYYKTFIDLGGDALVEAFSRRERTPDEVFVHK
jgi:hypothetical protein